MPAPGRLKQEDGESGAKLGHSVRLQSAWNTQQDLVSPQQTDKPQTAPATNTTKTQDRKERLKCCSPLDDLELSRQSDPSI